MLCLIVAGILLAAHVTIILVVYLAVNGLLIVGAILFERRGYPFRCESNSREMAVNGRALRGPDDWPESRRVLQP